MSVECGVCTHTKIFVYFLVGVLFYFCCICLLAFLNWGTCANHMNIRNFRFYQSKSIPKSLCDRWMDVCMCVCVFSFVCLSSQKTGFIVRCFGKCPTFFSSTTSPGRSFLCTYLFNVCCVCMCMYVFVCNVGFDLGCWFFVVRTDCIRVELLVCILMGTCAGFGGYFICMFQCVCACFFCCVQYMRVWYFVFGYAIIQENIS